MASFFNDKWFFRLLFYLFFLDRSFWLLLRIQSNDLSDFLPTDGALVTFRSTVFTAAVMTAWHEHIVDVDISLQANSTLSISQLYNQLPFPQSFIFPLINNLNNWWFFNHDLSLFIVTSSHPLRLSLLNFSHSWDLSIDNVEIIEVIRLNLSVLSLLIVVTNIVSNYRFVVDIQGDQHNIDSECQK